MYPLVVGIFALGFLITYLALSLSKVSIKKFPSLSKNSYANATPAPLNQVNPQKGVYNIILLGYGGAGHDGALLTDSMIVVHIDTNSKKVALISIPRDLWVSGNHKINAIGSINGFQNVGSTIQDVTGLPINYFVSVDFGGFSKIIDDLGGISVTVPQTFDDAFFPITGQENNTCDFSEDQINVFKAKYSGFQLERQFTCRYEHIHFDKGAASLDGATALKFVRSRHGDSDFGRSLRQFAVLQGIAGKLISLQAAGKFNDIVTVVSQIVKTDLDLGTVKSLVSTIGDPNPYKSTQIQLTTNNVLNEGTASDGEYILYPKAGMLDFSGVKTFISSAL